MDLSKLLVGFNPWSLLPWVIGVPAVFMAGAWWDGDRREDRILRKVVVEFTNAAVTDELACMTDKAQAWEEVRNTRANAAAQAATFERVLGAGDAERAAFRLELKASELQARKARDEAAQTMKRLDDARSDLATAWKDGRIPADITCGVLLTPGCPGIPGSAAGAADARGEPLSPGPAGEHAAAPQPGGGAAVSGVPADRPRDP